MPEKGESNNQGDPATSIPQHMHDPEYYFDDNSQVFLVDDVLFKFSASRLSSTHSIVRFTPKPVAKRTAQPLQPIVLFDPSRDLSKQPGSSDEDPIRIPQFTAPEFRTLLLTLFGRLGDEKYMEFAVAPQHRAYHSRCLFLRYLRLRTIARSFGLDKLSRWASERVDLILRESATTIAEGQWEEQEILEVVSAISDEPPKGLIPDDKMERNLANFLRLILFTSVNSSLVTGNIGNSNLEVCVTLYKNRECLSDSALTKVLSCLFLVILSLGPRSLIWSEKLTRDEKLTFYTAYTDLVSLGGDSRFSLSWFQPEAKLPPRLCDACPEIYPAAWRKTFGRLGYLDSSVPLEDVRKILDFPRCRQLFAQEVRALASDRSCRLLPGCIILHFLAIDGCIEDFLYSELPAVYEEFSR